MQEGAERNTCQTIHTARQDPKSGEPVVERPVHKLNGPDDGNKAEDPV